VHNETMEALKLAGDLFDEHFTQQINSMYENASAFAKDAHDQVAGTLQNATDAATGMVDDAHEVATGHVNAAHEWATGQVENATDFVKGHFEDAQAAIQGPIDDAHQQVTNTVNDVHEQLTGHLTDIAGEAQGVLDSAAGAVTGAIDDVADAASDVAEDAIDTVAETAINMTAEYREQASEFIGNMTDKYLDGINNASKKLAEYAEKAKKYVDVIKDMGRVFGIGAPYDVGVLKSHFRPDDGYHNVGNTPGFGPNPNYAKPTEGIGLQQVYFEGVQETPFMGLENGKTLITFAGGGSALEFTHTSTSDMTLTQSTDLQFVPTLAGELKGGFEMTSPMILKFGMEGEFDGSAQFSLSHTQDTGRSRSWSVLVKLADADNGDKFYITLHTDQMFGTPVFKLVGGLTSCPGEPGTNWAEDHFEILRYIGKNPECTINECRALEVGEIAEFAVQFSNSGGDVQQGFILISKGMDPQTLSDETFTQGQCGTPGRVGGLVIMARGEVLGTKAYDLDYVPQGVSELIIHVDTVSPCLEYNNIALAAVSSCEWTMRGSLSLMFPLELGEDGFTRTTVDENFGFNRAGEDCDGYNIGCDAIGLDKSKTFSVSWCNDHTDVPTQAPECAARRLQAKTSPLIAVTERWQKKHNELTSAQNEISEWLKEQDAQIESVMRTHTLYILGACTLVLVVMGFVLDRKRL